MSSSIKDARHSPAMHKSVIFDIRLLTSTIDI